MLDNSLNLWNTWMKEDGGDAAEAGLDHVLAALRAEGAADDADRGVGEEPHDLARGVDNEDVVRAERLRLGAAGVEVALADGVQSEGAQFVRDGRGALHVARDEHEAEVRMLRAEVPVALGEALLLALPGGGAEEDAAAVREVEGLEELPGHRLLLRVAAGDVELEAAGDEGRGGVGTGREIPFLVEFGLHLESKLNFI